MKLLRSLNILLILCVAFSACKKDLGNYDYQPINELTIANVDIAKGYSVNFNSPLTISPQIKGTQDPDGTKGSYTYEWSLYAAAGDSVISIQKDLNVRLTKPPGSYTLQLKVMDKTSGVSYGVKTTLLVTTKVFEGFMVLNDVNGQSRLDMVTYYRTTGLFEQHTDILKEMSSALPTQGKPIQVYCTETEPSTLKTAQSYRIYLVTQTGTNKIDPETFGWNPTSAFKYEVSSTGPTDFRPVNIAVRTYAGSIPFTLFMEGGNIYRRGSGGQNFAYVPLNIYTGNATPFRAYPELVSGFLVATMFDMDKRAFTSLAVTSGATSVTSVPPSANMPSGKDMVYMESMANGNGYAVMKDVNAANYYILRFAAFFSVSSTLFDQVPDPTIALAEHFAFSPDLGYLFYSVGGKLYEYDAFLKKSFLMLDKGQSNIDYIAFPKITGTANANYVAWAKQLLVGTSNPSGTPGSNGTLEQYAVPPINAPLQLKNTWTGFGKIASVSYRERN